MAVRLAGNAPGATSRMSRRSSSFVVSDNTRYALATRVVDTIIGKVA